MNIKSEKGFTVIDIATAIIILFIFVTLISILSYNFNSSSDEIEIKSNALELAIQEIEKIKNKSIESIEQELTNEGVQYGTSTQTATMQEIKPGYYRKVIIEDYHDIDEDKVQGIVKRVKVQIIYKYKKQEQIIELAGLLSK